MTSSVRRFKWSRVVLLGLTLLALLPGGTPQALDARTGAPVAGVRLELPALSVALEPLAAPLHVVAGSPDYRHVGAWVFTWTFLGFGLAGWRRTGGFRGLFGWASAGCLGLLFWLAVGVFLPIPGWRLAVDDPGWIVADLHSHTFTSHDGLVSATDNLSTHADNGYAVVAVTDHKHPEGGFDALRRAGEGDPAVLAGVEVRSPINAYLLGIGLKPNVPLVRRHDGEDHGFEQRFIEEVHRNHGGAVVVLSHRLEPEDAERLAAEGVDGFEIANLGHPAPPPQVDHALRRVAHDRNLPLVASSDWHGWGALFRTWTLVRAAGHGNPAHEVLEALREHRVERVIPVTAGPLGAVTGWRAAVAPVLELVRYLRGLGPLRLGVWALWLAAWIAWRRVVGRWVRRPGRVLGALATAGGSLVLWWRGIGWVAAGASGTVSRSFPAVVGSQILVAALVGFVAAWFLVRGAGRVPRSAARSPNRQAAHPIADGVAPELP